MNAPDTNGSAPLILVADDDELIRTLVTGALTTYGFQTLEATNGQEAVDAIGNKTPDLVILDIDMPVMDGYTACAHIRTLPHGARLPIVIMTGNEDTDSIECAYSAGATDFISKPVNWPLLGHRVRYILRNASLHDALAEREAENKAILEAIPDRVIRLTASGEILDFESAERDSTSPGVGSGPSLREHFGEDTAALLQQAIRTVLGEDREVGFEFTESAQENANGTAGRSFEIRVVPHSAGVVLAIQRDVTTRKATEARIEELAFFDELTSLPNRHHFMELANSLVCKADPGVDKVALCTINLDRFKRINDTLGLEAGDSILATVAGRLAELKNTLLSRGMRAEISRLGADQFALVAGWSSRSLGAELPLEIMSAFQRSVHHSETEVLISASVGIASYPGDGQDIATLLKKADRALYAAKRRGRSQYCRYSELRGESSDGLLLLESDLKKAIDLGELRLVFQPKFHLKSGLIVGAEALIRWEHPKHGLTSPATFIPLAEESGLISDIDRWVVDTTAERLSQWQRAGLEVVPISVNLSGREFCYAQPANYLKTVLEKHQIDPALLEIEITETVMMVDPTAAASTLNQFKAMGIRLALDDFGTGYSSLGYLKNYPLDVLKIDRAFVKDLQSSERDLALCRSIIAMAKGLGMECVAEGIETDKQRQILLREGCDVAQGYALARPMDEQQYLWTLAHNRHAKPMLAAMGNS